MSGRFFLRGFAVLAVAILGVAYGWGRGPLDARPRALRVRLAAAPIAALKPGQGAALHAQLTRQQAAKHCALRVLTASGRAPAGLKVNGRDDGQRPVRGEDGWYYLIPAADLAAGDNALELAPPAQDAQPPAEVELASLESAAEAIHFRQFFGTQTRQAMMSQPPSDPDQLKFDVLHYDLAAVLDMSQAALTSATLTMTARSLDPALTRVPLDLSANGGALVVSAVDGGDGAQPLAFVHDAAASRLVITLPEPVAGGQDFTVRVFYHGFPESGSAVYGNAFGRTTHGSGVPIISTLSEPYGARVWWPCKDVPDDKATMDLRITCPDAYMDVSNGSLVEVTERGDGTHTYHWRESYPLATYLASVTCTNFEPASTLYTALDGQTTMTLTHYVYPERSTEGSSAVAGTRQIMQFYAQTFGEYPFLSEKYSDVHFPDSGAMEHQTCTSILPGLIGPDGLNTVNAHELSHQWFGDKITMRHFDHLWLNEGFATYCEALFDEHRSGAAAYHTAINGDYVSDAYPLVGPQADQFDGSIVYDKGAWVLHMLRHVLGDAAFFQGLRDYINDPALAYGTALSSDFQAHMETAGGRPLGWFFNEWLYQTARPSFTWSWMTDATDSSHTLYVWVKQTQSGDPYTMPVDVRVSDGSAVQTRTITVERAEQVFKIDDLGAPSPASVAWDPDRWVLDTVQQVGFPAQALWTSAPALDFGPTRTGTEATLALQLEAVGTQPLSIDSIAIDGADAAVFEVSGPQTPFTLELGAAQGQTLSVRFYAERAGGALAATLTINTAVGATQIPLSGIGQNVNQARGWSGYR